MKNIITLIQTILGFLILGCFGGLENDTMTLTATIITVAASCVAIYALQMLSNYITYVRANNKTQHRARIRAIEHNRAA